MELTLQDLECNDIKCNIKKSFFRKTYMECLGFWMTRNRIQTTNKKLKAMEKMTPPKNQKLVRVFIGLVNYYRDMWSRQSHLLKPLTSLTSDKLIFKCTGV